MNLADALREAAWGSENLGLRVETGGAVPSSPPSALSPEPLPLLRLELQLSHEQLAAVLRTVLARGHSVLTMREAAALLRVDAPTLERMAERGELPAFRIEGRWRFPRAGIEEWLAERTRG